MDVKKSETSAISSELISIPLENLQIYEVSLTLIKDTDKFLALMLGTNPSEQQKQHITMFKESIAAFSELVEYNKTKNRKLN